MADGVLSTHLLGWSRCVRVSFFFLLLILETLPRLGGVVEGQVMQCVGTDGCRCTMDDGSVIDVSSLGTQGGTPTFDKVQAQDLYYYSFNPCFGFSEGACADAAVCQWTSDQQTSYQAGDANTATWSFDGVNAIVYYFNSAPDAFRQSYVTYKCDPTASAALFSATGDLYGASTYYFDVTTKCACPGACSRAEGGGGNSEGGLSAGSVMTIIFFSLLFVYLVAGIVFNKTQRQATGANVIPNVTFWQALPGLIKEGFMFVISKVRPGRSGYSEM